jgi:Protein involved in formate dehydrogenase formation
LKWNPFSRSIGHDRSVERAAGRWAAPLQAALADLERLIAARPELDSPGRTLARILWASFDRRAWSLRTDFHLSSNGSSLEINGVPIAWEQRRPVLHDLALDFADVPLAEAALAIVRALQEEKRAAARGFEQSVLSAPERVAAWARWTLCGETEHLTAVLRELELDATFVESVLRVLLLPELAPLAEKVCAGLAEVKWPHGWCPLCGASPALVESRGLEERRYLRCDQCGGDWPWTRFRCPFCDETDHRRLRYQYLEGEGERYRRAICDRCGRRIKIAATLAPLSPPGLLVAELASIHLDLIDDPIAPTD